VMILLVLLDILEYCVHCDPFVVEFYCEINNVASLLNRMILP